MLVVCGVIYSIFPKGRDPSKEEWYNFNKVVRVARGEGNKEKITNK